MGDAYRRLREDLQRLNDFHSLKKRKICKTSPSEAARSSLRTRRHGFYSSYFAPLLQIRSQGF